MKGIEARWWRWRAARDSKSEIEVEVGRSGVGREMWFRY